VAEPPEAATGLALHELRLPLLIESVTDAVDDVTTLPKASSTVTTGCVENAGVGSLVTLADPDGWVENTSWLAVPGPETPKALLVTGLVATELLAVAVNVYGVAK
jgi:hypothetical protein